MTYTSHGHHIEGSPLDTGDAPPKARCGGPGLCSLCSSQAAQWAQANARERIISELDADKKHEGRIVAHKFVSIPTQVEAIQFTGGPAIGMDIEAWVKCHGGNATWRNGAEPWTASDGVTGHNGWPETLTVQTLEGFTEALPGWWIIRGSEGDFYPLPDETFKKKYKEIQ